jgi:excisionase family DNA binding protein
VRGNEEPDTAAIFARIPRAQAEKLDRLAFELKIPKREIIAGLVAQYEPGEPPRDVALDELTVGRVGFRAGVAEVLTLEQAAAFLQTSADAVAALAETGDIPARKLGTEWRFSRRAIVAWLEGER